MSKIGKNRNFSVLCNKKCPKSVKIALFPFYVTKNVQKCNKFLKMPSSQMI